MRRLFALAALVLAASALRAESPALTIHQQLLPSPAAVGATAPVFIASPENLLLAWKDPAFSRQNLHVSSTWDRAASRWSAPKPTLVEEPGAATPRVHFPDGSQLSAFFPEKDGRILDLHTQRHRRETNGPPQPLSADSWPQDITARSIAEPPLLRSREARVVAVWLNHGEKSPRLFAALSTNAGDRFFLPVRIDDGQPLGSPSLVLLRDGSAYVTWIESYGPAKNASALWLRRLSPGGDLSVPVLIATASSTTALGHPQLALLKDEDATPAQLLIAHELMSDNITQLVTRLITLPPAKSFAQGRPCLTCPPDEASKPGHPLFSSRVIQVISGKGQLVIEHPEVPGILPAGTTTFRIDDKILNSLQNPDRISARIEQRDGIWWLFDVVKETRASRH